MLLGRFGRMGIKGGLFVFLVFGLAGIAGLGAVRAFADNDREPAAIRSRAFRLRHLSNVEAKASLEAMQIGTSVDLLPHNSLIVTSGETDDLTRAANLLKLTDSADKYRIEVIADWTGASVLPSGKQIASRAGLGTVGTFMDPPAPGAAGGIIVDIHNGKVVAAAPAKVFDRVKGTFAAIMEMPAGEGNTAVAAGTQTAQETAGRLRMGPPANLARQHQAEARSVALVSEKTTVVQNRGVLGGWGPALASAQTNPIGAPRPAPLAAELELDMEDEVEAEDHGESVAAEEINEDDAVMSDGEMEEAAEEGDQAAEGDDDGNEAVAEHAVAESEMADADDGTAALLAMLQQLAASSQDMAATAQAEQAADETSESAAPTRPAAERITTTSARPPVPTPRAPVSTRSPETTAAAGRIETQTAAEAPPVPLTDKELQTVIVLPERVEILSLIEMVGKQLGLNYMFDPKQVAGEVMLKIHDGKIKVKDMYALLESVLRFRNLAMTRRGNLVTIVPLAQAADQDPVLWREGEIEFGQVIVTTIYQLKHIDTATAQQMLSNMRLGVTFNAIEETRTLIITDYAYRMGRIEEILKLVDVRGRTRNYHSRKLRYVLPSEMAAKVLAIAQQMGTLSVTVGHEITTAPQPVMPPATPGAPQPARPATPQPILRQPTPVRPGQAQARDAGVYLDTDDRTNRILMVGLEEDIETVNMIIDSLDVERYGLKTVKEYPMRFVEATDLLDTLYELGVISSQPSARTSTLPSRVGPTTRTATTAPTAARPPVTTPAGTFTPGAAAVSAEPQISVRLSTNSLLVNATAEHHREIEMVIRFVDIEQQDVRRVQQYEIQYVDLQEVVGAMTDLGIIEARGASSTAAARRAGTTPATPARPTAAGAAAGAAGGEGPAPTVTFEATTGAEITSQQPQIAILESTNSLLVYATPKQHETISLVVTHVDRELPSTSTPYVVYALENQDPDELAATLNEIIQATVRDAGRSPDSKIQTTPGGAGGAGTGSVLPPKRERNEIQIVPDPKSYSLVVYADKKNQQWISDLIRELDAYRPQVHLDVTLVEITKDNEFKFDLDLITKIPQFAAGGSMVSAAVGALVQPFPGRQVLEAASRGGAGIAFFSDKHIQALLEIVDSKNYGRILARPSLLVKDNQPGEIKAEKTIYVAQQKTTTVPSTSDNYLPITDVSFQAYTSGVTLAITPHIASDKILQLEITLDRTDFVMGTGETAIGNTKYPKPLDTISSNLGTWAVLPDGATIILGGIESINQSKTVTKVPILGDIPIIGGLFRGVANTDMQSRLYVFVKATILRPSDELTGISDIESVSKKKREAFEQDETRFQQLEGIIPGKKPRPLAPERILEDNEYVERLKAMREDEQFRPRRQDEPVRVEVDLNSAETSPGRSPQSPPVHIMDDRY